MIYFNNSQEGAISYALKMLIRRSVIAALDYEGYENDCEISITLTDNKGIHAINKQFRNIDAPTDVLSFPLVEYEESEEPPVDEENMLGDIIISLERAEEQANEFGHSFEREVSFLTVHSMLHLLGYDHVNSEEEDKEMRRRQSEIMKNLGLEVK
jgi:probable rRNA maturation factor